MKIQNYLLKSFGLVVTWCSIAATSFSQTVDFSTLSEGSVLSDQLQSQGVKLLPFQNTIKGEVATSLSGKIALFDVCANCEFFLQEQILLLPACTNK